ncbi:MAG: Na-translocating system protein MpsB, partial [Gammaproteobacteria bacterium]
MPGEDLHSGGDIRERLRQGVAHLEHLLPGQAAIRDFVHHNTLHGFEHLPFPRALEAARRATGNYGYLPDAQFRELYRQGRIRRDDLCRVLEASPSLKA